MLSALFNALVLGLVFLLKTLPYAVFGFSMGSLKTMFFRGQQDREDYQNTSTAIANGDVVNLQNRIGICTSPEGIAASSGIQSLGSLAIAGVFRMKKATNSYAAVFQQGDQVWWDTVAFTAYNAPGSNRIYAGLADIAAPMAWDNVPTDINKLPSEQVIASMYGAGTTTTSTTTTS